MNSAEKKVIIVGGVAGGANVAARLRRLDERCRITIHERGKYVSFANCGLPYYIGKQIEKREKLLLHTPESLKKRFAIDVRVGSEVVSIDRSAKTVTAKDTTTNQISVEPYDILVLSPGAAPLRPDLPGINLPGIHTLRDMRDMDEIIAALDERPLKNVAIIGGGFIGLEMAEQLQARLSQHSPEIRLIEAAPHVLPPLDSEMAVQIEDELRRNGIKLQLGEPVTGFEASGSGLVIQTGTGGRYAADLVLLNIGVRPETGLAKNAGLEIGARGGIKVDSELRTSDPAIFAVGDCIETKHLVTGELGIIPLAGPANRQGRIVANIISGKNVRIQGTLGTAIVRVFETIAATTGPNERTLDRLAVPHRAVYLHPSSHAGYYPGAKPIHLKLLYAPDTGKILGAQAVGSDGVDKRIDVIATAITGGLAVEDLTDLELCYAPPFGSAKDPVNLAGMVAQNVQDGLVEIVSPASIGSELADSVLLDVRDNQERAGGFIPNSLHIPLPEIRSRISELPKDKNILVFCQSGQRSYIACRILSQHGLRCKNLTGAYKSWTLAEKALKKH